MNIGKDGIEEYDYDEIMSMSDEELEIKMNVERSKSPLIDAQLTEKKNEDLTEWITNILKSE